MRIIIYGLNYSGIFLEQIKGKNTEIIGYTDSFTRISSFNGKKFYCLEELPHAEFDYIVLVVQNRNVSDDITNNLVHKYGIARHKIVNIHALLAETKVDRVMGAVRGKLDGLVLGISHAVVGINPTLLEGNWRNLATNHEDIYYHYQVLKRCVEKYPKATENLSSIIIDMYDYIFFNYDLSLTGNICHYWSVGGIWDDMHNFDKNALFNCSQDEAMKDKGYFLPDKNMQLLAEKIFDRTLLNNRLSEFYKYHGYALQGSKGYPEESQCRNILPQKVEIEVGKYFNIDTKKHTATIEENEYILNETFRLIKQINPNMKVYLILIPRFYETEEMMQRIKPYMDFKEDFEATISKFNKSYNFQYWDMKNMEGISRNRYFYNDPGHLNYYGGLAFTSVINDMIKAQKV